jgi:hypothetical protein
MLYIVVLGWLWHKLNYFSTLSKKLKTNSKFLDNFELGTHLPKLVTLYPYDG